jgi:deoxyribodipyrimidine photo-lyase
MIQAERVRQLNDKSVRAGRYVLYWMQASQRAEWNHALEYAVERANELKLPLAVYFGLTDDFPEANLRHYAFMLEGLREVQISLESRGIKLVVRRGSPEAGAVELSEDAALLVTDRGYLRVQKKWRRHVARKAHCPVIEVECDVVVPVGITSTKEEYSAATIRTKIHKRLDEFLRPLRARRLKADSSGLSLEGIDLSDLDAVLASLKVDSNVGRQSFYRGGTSRAKNHLSSFMEKKLADYAEKRNDPSLGIWSNMSPYLHFGQISPLYVALRVRGAKRVRSRSKDAYLEELIVRRELSVNFVNYNPHYDSYKCLHSWAVDTLEKHSRDKREFIYTRGELESADTHDPYWNAAMKEMALTGKMANYMRMYWGKKIIEWSSTPRAAFRTALYLNNKHFLDGRDPNSFAGVAWCFGKHDRAWTERPVFGKVRYMNAAGLERKFDIDRYVDSIARLET